MKTMMRVFLAMLILGGAAFAQTEDLGMGAFANEQGAIKLAVDAAWVIREINGPYVMFVLYMAAAKEGQNIIVGPEGVVMLYNGQEYKMPSYAELRKNYNGEIHDVTFYRRLEKKDIKASWIRGYRFSERGPTSSLLTRGRTLRPGHCIR